MAESRWYDRFAPFYDVGTIGDLFYRTPRKAAVEHLDLSSGCSVADLFCGTGVDFPLLATQVGEQDTVLAVDVSKGMLEQEKARAERCGVSRRFKFLQADFSQAEGLKTLEEAIDKEAPQHVFFSLGLTRLENWREFCSLVFLEFAAKSRSLVPDKLTRLAAIRVSTESFSSHKPPPVCVPLHAHDFRSSQP